MSAIEPFSLVKDKMSVFIHLRIEKHGENNVNAYDAKLSGNFSNSVLLKLHPDLRDTFYKAAQQADIDGFKKELRFPRIAKPVAWDLEIPRTLLRLHDVHDANEDLILSDGTTDNFVFDMLEGGTVKLSCRVKLAEMSEEQVAKLLRANGQEMPISLECAALEEKPDNFEQAELITQEPISPAREKAESMFSAPPDDQALNVAQSPDDVVDATYIDPATTAAPVVKAKRGGKRAAGAGIE